jgi:ParB family transcriptional regulator, chromosome partitioning protein
MPKQVLGRGLEALIPTQTKTAANKTDNAETSAVTHIPITKIVPNPHQPRRNFATEELSQLAASIKKHGVLQPVVVTKINGGFELIAGERRTKAAKLAGLENIPAIIKEATEQDKLELAMIENLQRHDLNPIEQAQAYRELINEFKLTQEGVAMRVSKSREAVANILRLLDLPDDIQVAVAQGKISVGHAKELLRLKSSTKQRQLFQEIVSGKITVRETAHRARQKKSGVVAPAPNPYLRELEEQLREGLGTHVQVQPRPRGIRIKIDCFSEDEIAEVKRRILGP